MRKMLELKIIRSKNKRSVDKINSAYYMQKKSQLISKINYLIFMDKTCLIIAVQRMNDNSF